MEFLCKGDFVNASFPSWTSDTCQADWINIIISSVSTYTAILLIAYLKWLERSRKTMTKLSNFKYHNLRSCLSIALFLTLWAEMAEAFLSDAPVHAYIVTSVSFSFLIFLIVLNHMIESTGRPALLLVTGFLWLANGVTRTLRFGVLYNMGVEMDRLRPVAAAVSAVISYIVSASELGIAIKGIGRAKAEPEYSPNEYHSYLYDEVNFFSKSTFYWMNSLLKSGYKLPIEVEDLGALPRAHSAKELHEKLEDIISDFEKHTRPATAWKLFLAFMKPEFWIGGFLKFFGDLVGIIGPLGISVIFKYAAAQKSAGDLPSESRDQMFCSVLQLWTNGWTAAFIVFFVSIAQSTFSQASTHFIIVKSIHLKVALQSLIYKKSLKLRGSPKSGHNISRQSGIERKLEEESMDLGVLINLISNDVTNIMSFFWIGHYIWAIPLKMSVIMFVLYMKLGISAIIGAVGTILVLMPLQLIIGKKMSRNTSAISELSDERLQYLSILLEKLKLFKLLGWENHYCSKILDVRNKELQLLDKDSIFWAISAFFTHVSSVFVSLITFGAHYLFSDIALTPEVVFSTLALINQLIVPLFIFPVIIPKIAEAMVSCKRISEFFKYPEVSGKREIINAGNSEKLLKGFKIPCTMTSINEEDEINLTSTESFYNQATSERQKENESINDGLSSSNENLDCCNSSDKNWIITIEDGVFSWTPEVPQKKLIIEKLKIQEGQVVAIIGKVGSGKTSLLSAILGEVPQINGKLKWSRKTCVGYCPQTPWLLNTTVRENILFGLPFRARRYDQVIAACALKPDLDLLPKKDLTEIGEKGINLSGGQKQRIAVARVLYSRADLIILFFSSKTEGLCQRVHQGFNLQDDPLSSLDLSTAATIFEEGIKRLVRKCKRTVVMVTHSFQFLSSCNLIIVMEDGKIRAQGQADDIRISEYELLKKWKETSLASNNLLKENRAKERWELVKSVAKIRRTSQVKEPDMVWSTEENMSSYLSLGKTRKFVENQWEWNYLIHDLLLPTDEFQNKIICPSSRRRNSMRKKDIGRARSLQDRHTKTAQVVRQYSSPLSTDTNKLYRRELISQFLRSYSRERVIQERKKSLERVASSESGVSDLFSDFPDGNVEIGENLTSNDLEEREYGTMRNKVYWSYIKACGLKISAAYLAITLTWQVVRVNTDFWLGVWIETPEGYGLLKYISIYMSLSVGAVILSLISHGVGQFAGSQARRKLHNTMLLNIVACPCKILECIPTGRLFNRFSADVDVIDKKLATTIQRLMQFLLLCSSSIVINTIITPWFIVMSIPIILLYYIIQMFYRCSSRELQRIDSTTRSTIFSHFSETLSGLSTIRAFGYEDKFLSSFYGKLNLNTNCFLMLNSTNRWLGIVLDYLGGFVVLLSMITTLLAVQFYPDSVNPSLAGLAMNYALLVPIYLNWVVKFFVDCEIYLGAVERIRQYTKFPSEKSISISEPGAFASKALKLGDIKFENVTASYGSSTESALCKINLHIPPGQKIGICGRSGSGKSTLALSLFNMLDIHEGTIKIDDTDITKIPLKLLRSSGSIIPQEALIFHGTVRGNLDISSSATDDQLWSAIEEAQLKELIETQYGNNLDSKMDGGQSLSGGEKQLFSLARAILQKSSFLIMDEATSNLDNKSEQILMSSALRVFHGKTLLIIAHRLSTILDCDRIIVLDKGKIVEDGTPSCLMNKTGGIFSVMVKSSEEGFLVP